jgi:glucosylceramidase
MATAAAPVRGQRATGRSPASEPPGRRAAADRDRRAPRRPHLRIALALGLVAASGLAGLSGDDVLRAPAPALVRSWITTPDGRQLLAAQPPVALSERTPAASLTVTVDPTRRYQVIDGFGASITDSSAAVLYRLDPRTRDATMVRLFAPGRGAGLSYLREPMGASDFVAGGFYTYDDVPRGATDYAMARFSVAHDEARILPLLRRARALNPQLRILATPWTAPAWMKTNGSLIGGSLIDDPRIYGAYALYFVKFLQAYAQAGVPVDAVTVQNEPEHATADYPGMVMSPAQEARFISVLGPALRRAGLRTAILAYDHNWGLAPADASRGPGKLTGDAYAERVLSAAAAARWVGGVAFHCYWGSAGAQADVHRADPAAGILLSECSGYRAPGETPAATFARSLGVFARLVIGATRNWAAGVLTWNLALGPNGGPHHGGCPNCTGVVTVGPRRRVTLDAEYYALASVSRLVHPGALRISSTSFPRAGAEGGLGTAAFRNRDGSMALVAYNAGTTRRRFTVQVDGDGRSFTTTLPGGGLGSYTWPGAVTSSDVTLLGDSDITATASPEAPADPCCTADTAARAVDDDAGTRWSTGHSQRPGDYLQLDLGARRRVDRLVLDTGRSAGDAPRRWALYAGGDAGEFGAPVAAGSGQGQLTSIPVHGVAARYLRVVLTGPGSTWWSVAEARVYVRR